MTTGTAPRPPKPKVNYRNGWKEHIPPEMKRARRWLNFRFKWDPTKYQGEGAWDKPPYVANPDLPLGEDSLRNASSTDPTTWRDWDIAVTALETHPDLYDGIGFATAAEDGLVLGDLDNAIAEDGEVLPWAQRILDCLDCIAHRSPSGRGIRLIMKGRKPDWARCKVTKYGPDRTGAVEFYAKAQYLTMTGDPIPGTRADLVDRTEELTALCRELWPAEYARSNGKGKAHDDEEDEGLTVGAAPGGILSDEAVLRLARGAKNGAKFRKLFDEGSIEDYGGDESRADFALIAMLTFYVGKNRKRVERLFRKSKLKRDKCDEKRPGGNYVTYCIDRMFAKIGPADHRGPQGDDDAQADHGGGEGLADAGTAPPPVFSNVRKEQAEEGGKPKTISIPLVVGDIDAKRREIFGDWPKCVGSTLFIEGRDGGPHLVESSTQAFAYFDDKAHVVWAKGEGCVSQERYFERLRMTVDRYDSVETVPHIPAIPGVYYMHHAIPTGTGVHLKKMLDFFRPATETDRELILSYILTLFWGGPAGHRPAFLVQGPDDDAEQGRGIGKTKVIDIPAEELTDGYIDVEPNDDIAKLKTRLLSGDSLRKRVCRLDNVKTLRLSWGDLEKFITSPIVSGHAMYQGEGRRPNHFVWGITVNGARLSKDMAKRVIPILIERPEYSPDWEHDTRSYIREHRWEIVADVLAMLSSEPKRIVAKTRWSRWERDVLAKVEGFPECQRLIVERQGAIDDDESEKDLVADHFRERIRGLGYDPEGGTYFLHSSSVALWLEEATGEKRATNRASTFLGGLGIPELRRSSDDGRRGWRWTGPDTNPRAPAEPIPRDEAERPKWRKEPSPSGGPSNGGVPF